MALGDIDPRLKTKIKELLFKQVYDAPLAQLQVKMDAIIAANQSATGNPSDWLLYRSKPYHHSRANGTFPPRGMARLEPSLQHQMAEYQAEELELNTEMALANSAIVGVLNASNAVEDFKLLLPDSMHPPLVELERRGELWGAGATGVKRASTEEIEAVRTKYDAGLTLLRRRMVLAMLG